MTHKIHGMLNVKDLAIKAQSGEIETVLAVFTDHYGRFLGKRLDVDFFLDTVHHNAGVGACNYLLTVDMEMQPVDGYAFANWQKGYGDFLLQADLHTLRHASWLDKTVLVICDVVHENKAPVSVAPRSILRQQTKAAHDFGFVAHGASELEYYIYEKSYRDAFAEGYRNLPAAGWYLEDYHVLQGTREEPFNRACRHHLKHSGIPVENSKGEWGLGQHELNVVYAEALDMADRHCIFKQCLKEVADAQGRSVTFMAKVGAEQAGSSCHIHISLSKDGKNAFAGTDDFHGVKCNDTFKWFLGGFMQHTPELMVCYAPTVNSYKRYQSASWAPTRIAWSVDNRTVGFRIVGHGESLRIECRLPGADCNPYLAYAAVLASGLDGIRKRITPPPAFKGNAYTSDAVPRVPMSLAEAAELFGSSTFAREALGTEATEHYAHFYRAEAHAYSRAVTDWERTRYFERI